MRLKPSQRRFAQQALALMGCLLLLYVASGAALLHQHSKGPDATCSVCQVLHAPALAVARTQLIPEAQQLARSSQLPERAGPTNTFALHRTPRAPPSA